MNNQVALPESYFEFIIAINPTPSPSPYTERGIGFVASAFESYHDPVLMHSQTPFSASGEGSGMGLISESNSLVKGAAL
jgi:hypothetical protein